MSKVKAHFSSVKCKRIFSTVAVVLWMAVIFAFSHQSKQVSGKVSSPIQNAVFEATMGDNEYETVRERNLARVKVGELVRSSAHFFCFTVLGVLSAIAFHTYGFKLWKNAIFSIIFGWTYSLTDEIHQYFVPGRTFQWADIGIDMLGVALGVAACTGVLWLKKRGKKNVEST